MSISCRREKTLFIIGMLSMAICAVAWGGELLSDGTIKSVGSLPLPIACLAVTSYAVYLMYKTADASNKAAENLAAVLSSIVRELHERPCIRSPKND